MTEIFINNKSIDLASLIVDDVFDYDYPDYVDAYIASGSYTDGTSISDDDLDFLGDDNPDLVNALANGVSLQHGLA
jgi:hypothetical protein